MTGTMLRHMLTSRTGREAGLSASEATCEIHVHATAVFRFLPAGVDMSCLIVGTAVCNIAERNNKMWMWAVCGTGANSDSCKCDKPNHYHFV